MRERRIPMQVIRKRLVSKDKILIMEDNQFSFKTFAEHTLAYCRAFLKQQLYKAGDMAGKAISYAVLLVILIVLGPVLLTLLFVALAFGFQAWIPSIGYGVGFLLSAASVIVVGLLLIWIVRAYTRSIKASVFTSIMNAADKLEESSTMEDEEERRVPEALFTEDLLKGGDITSNKGVSS